MEPLVSIIIPVYNGANFMREAIDSALAQTYKNVEIIVINDGSNDGNRTRKIALSYGNKISYYEKENGGVATALNLGLKKMHGEYFSWLSHDDWYKPNKIEYEVEALRETGDGGRVVFSACDFVDWPDGHVEKTTYLRYSEEFIETGWFAVAFGLISGCTLLIPKVFFEKYGGFDEKLRGVQDYKKWFEMFRNEQMVYIDKNLVCSRVHTSQVTNQYDRMAVEEDWLYSWIAKSLREDEMHKLGLSLYLFYGVYLNRWLGAGGYEHTKAYIVQQMNALPEPQDGNDKRLKLAQKLRGDSHRAVYVYCAGMYGRNLLAALRWRDCFVDGVVDSNPEFWGKQIDNYKCISYKELPKDALIIVANARPSSIKENLIVHGFKHVKNSIDLDLDLLMTPINKAHCELLSK